MSWWSAVVWIGATVALGAWVVDVLDDLIGRVVAGGRVRPVAALSVPLRRTADLVLRSPTTTERSDGPGWTIAPALLGSMGATALVVIPVAPTVVGAEVADGIVYFGAAMALVMVAVFLHGWSANAPMPLIGAYRFVAQALSYEMPLALVLIGAALPAQSLAIGDIVASQGGLWNVIRMPLGLPLYLVAGYGLAFLGPLALPDGTDLGGGTTAEVSGTALLAWRLGRAAVLLAVAAMGAAVFLGGWQGPWLAGPTWMALKTLALLVLMIGGGHLVPRVRPERFVVVAWAVLIPLALVDVFVTGVWAL